jgi:hypothetical protein
VNLREALIIQSPSLELQRAAADEIARLDGVVKHLATIHYESQAQLGHVRIALQGAVEYDKNKDVAGYSYHDMFNYVQAALACMTKEPA